VFYALYLSVWNALRLVHVVYAIFQMDIRLIAQANALFVA